MSISQRNFDEISEADLQALIDTGTPEGIAIEYKRDSYGGSDADKKELLKDMSSFANTSGGHILIGGNPHRYGCRGWRSGRNCGDYGPKSRQGNFAT